MLCPNHSWDVPGPGVPQIAIFTIYGNCMVRARLGTELGDCSFGLGL